MQYGVPVADPRGDQRNRDRLRQRPLGLLGRRGRLDAVHARTWLQYGVDALNAGYADPYNPVDAIFAAARYLRPPAPRPICAARDPLLQPLEEYVESVCYGRS